MKSILITRALFPDILNTIEKNFNLIVWSEEAPPPKKWILDNLSTTEALISMLNDKIDGEVIRTGKSNKLKVISQMAVGYDNIDVQSATKNHIPVGNTPGVLTETTADFTWALLMSLARQVLTSHNEVHKGIWQPWGPEVYAGTDVFGKTFGIIGFGRIGQAVARRAQGFGMKILVSTRDESKKKEQFPSIQFTDLKTLLSESDFITLHANLNPASKGLIGIKQLALMKPTSLLINTARGAMVDNDALVEALLSQKLAGAALDVFDPEPIPADHPLLKMPNVIITPHIASASLATRRKMAEMAIENAIAGIEDKHLPYCVNPEIYNN
jgi:glyoxylate reductase